MVVLLGCGAEVAAAVLLQGADGGREVVAV
jgi:hypothetical protein